MTRFLISLIEPVPKAKSKAAQIAELLPEIEAALTAGHSHRAIFEQVENALGIGLTFGYYENTIHRIRQRQEAKGEFLATPLMVQERPPSPITVDPTRTPQFTDAPTSKLQAALSESVDDFFS